MPYISSRNDPGPGPNPSDPIADVIGLLRPRTAFTGSLRAAGPWAIRYESAPHVKLGTIARGECWLALDGSKPVLLEEGDFYLLGNPPRYVMGSALSLRPRAATALWATAANGVFRIGRESDEDTCVRGGLFVFDDPNAPLLLDLLPPLVRVRAGDPRGEFLGHLCELLVNEVDAGAAGGSFVVDRLAQILFVHLLRAHADPSAHPTGWLGALGDPRIGAALRAIHADVAHRWSLAKLAELARMSRSSFAASFKRKVGSAPVDYLIQWRMSLARDALRHGSQSISELAFAVGHESESAFSTAFRRVVGSSPKQFRDQTPPGVSPSSRLPAPGAGRAVR